MGLPARYKGRLASGRSTRRDRFSGIAIFGFYIAGGWLLPGRKLVIPYSIQTLKRLRPVLFRQEFDRPARPSPTPEDQPLIAQRFPLAEARAHELLGKGGVTGKIVLVCNGWSLKSVAVYGMQCTALRNAPGARC